MCEADQVECCAPLAHNLSRDVVCTCGRVRGMGVEGDLATAAEHTHIHTCPLPQGCPFPSNSLSSPSALHSIHSPVPVMQDHSSSCIHIRHATFSQSPMSASNMAEELMNISKLRNTVKLHHLRMYIGVEGGVELRSGGGGEGEGRGEGRGEGEGEGREMEEQGEGEERGKEYRALGEKEGSERIIGCSFSYRYCKHTSGRASAHVRHTYTDTHTGTACGEFPPAEFHTRTSVYMYVYPS